MRDNSELAGRAWRLWMAVARRQFETTKVAVEQMGLSMVMGRCLDELIKQPPGPMSQLVTRLEVDAAWVTAIVDRLEARGDVVRRPSPGDRRVRILEVTEAGRETHREMERLFSTPPPELLGVREEDLRALLRTAERLSGDAEARAHRPRRDLGPTEAPSAEPASGRRRLDISS